MGMPRRPDQSFDPPTGAVGAGSDAGVFRGRLVVISGSSTNASTGLFVYSGIPALGDLVASIASTAGTDQYGNAYIPTIAVYMGSQAIQLESSGGVLLQNFLTGSANEAAPSQLKVGTGGGTLQFIIGGPTDTTSADAVFVNLSATPHSTADLAKGFLAYQLPAGGDVNLLSWGGDGVFRGTLAGNTGSIALQSTDGFSRTVTSTALNQLTFNYPVNANDPIVTAGHQNTTYGIRCGGTGVQGSTAEALTFALVGFGGTLNTFQFLAPTLPANHGFTWYMDASVEILTTGAAGTAEVVGIITLFDTTALLAVGTVPFVGSVGSLNTTANTSLSVQAQWASAAFGCTITCPASVFTRWGP